MESKTRFFFAWLKWKAWNHPKCLLVGAVRIVMSIHGQPGSPFITIFPSRWATKWGLSSNQLPFFFQLRSIQTLVRRKKSWTPMPSPFRRKRNNHVSRPQKSGAALRYSKNRWSFAKKLRAVDFKDSYCYCLYCCWLWGFWNRLTFWEFQIPVSQVG